MLLGDNGLLTSIVSELLLIDGASTAPITFVEDAMRSMESISPFLYSPLENMLHPGSFIVFLVSQIPSSKMSYLEVKSFADLF